MARLLRANPANFPVHILHRGNNRQACFKNSVDYSAFLWWLRKYSEKFLVEIHSWALMENHYHLLCTPMIEGGLSRMVQALGRQYVRYFNRQYQRTGHKIFLRLVYFRRLQYEVGWVILIRKAHTP